jgi:hypothetical protein
VNRGYRAATRETGSARLSNGPASGLVSGQIAFPIPGGSMIGSESTLMRRAAVCTSGLGALLWLGLGCGTDDDPGGAGPSEWLTLTGTGITLEYRQADESLAQQSLSQGESGRVLAETFLATAMGPTVRMRLFPTRAALESEWGTYLGPGFVFQCWMIAGFTESMVLMLSPQRWVTESCGHPADPAYVARVVAHELIHVLHRRVNGSNGLTGQPSWWFVEGLATLGSRQYEEQGMAAVAQNLLAGGAPPQLELLLQGDAGYALSASLVAYIDTTWGRSTLVALLSARSEAELLTTLGVSEAELLSQWEAWVTGP